MKGADLLARWAAARAGEAPRPAPTAADEALFPAVPGSVREAGTTQNACKSGLFPLFPPVPGISGQGCNVGPCEAERERADDAGPGDAPDADDAAPEPPPLPFRLAAWGDAADVPRPGDTCGTCSRRSPRGGRWWCEATAPKGWRCARCHPGDHVPEAERFEVLT